MSKLILKLIHSLSVLAPFGYLFYIFLDGIALTGKFHFLSLGGALQKLNIDIQVPYLESEWETIYAIYYLMISTPLIIWLVIICAPIAVITYNRMDGY